MLPNVASCRDCHGGETTSLPVPSNCAMCHDYHMDQGVPDALLRQQVRGRRWTTTVVRAQPVGGARRLRPERDDRMLIAQITDLHLGFDPADPDEFNRQRLDRTLAALCVLHPVPDMLLVTGDIADNGDDGVSYARYAEAIARAALPGLAGDGQS